MEFANTSSSSSNVEVLPVSASGSILSSGNIAINDLENGVVNIGLPVSSFYPEGKSINCIKKYILAPLWQQVTFRPSKSYFETVRF